jgi:hypothetical protein
LIVAANLSTTRLMPRVGPKPLVAFGMLAAAGAMAWLAQLGQQLGASVGTSLLNTIFAAAVTSYTAAHLASARLIGRPALTGQALVHGYDTAFWWTAGFFAAGAVVGGLLLRRGPLVPAGTPAPAPGGVPTAPGKAAPRPSA